MMKQVVIIISFILLFLSEGFGETAPSEYVILLHGLARSKSSMAKLESHLSDEGYSVLNIAYPSRSKTIEELAGEVIPKAIERCRNNGAKKIHFVTHSMGGIVVRYYLKHYALPEL